MKQCKQCGNTVNDNVNFCNNCGSPVENTVNQAAQPNGQPNQAAGQQNQTNDFASNFANINNTPDTTAEFDPADIEQNKIIALFSYLSWLVLIPIFAAPKSKFARFHANQGLVLAIVEIVWVIAQSILTGILIAISWRLAFLASILSLVNIVFLVFAILGIVNAVSGKAKELPIIGKIRILK